MRPRLKYGENFPAFQLPLNGAANWHHVEGILHDLGGIVCGTVVYHNNFIKFIIQLQQGADGEFNGNSLVMSRDNNGYRNIAVIDQLIF